MVEIDSYSRECNYFQNLENALDMSHIGFVHGDNVAIFKGIGLGRALDAEESDWGVTYGFTRPDGQRRVQQFGMPNIFYLTALPTDPEIGWQESMFWWVPIDDTNHMQFSVHRVPAQGDVGEAPARAAAGAARARSRSRTRQLASDVLEGRASMRDVDKKKVDLVRLQDDVAQVGQGADRRARRRAAGPRRCRRDRHPPAVGARARRLHGGPADQEVEARRLDRAARLGPGRQSARTIGGEGTGARQGRRGRSTCARTSRSPCQLKALHAPITMKPEPGPQLTLAERDRR